MSTAPKRLVPIRRPRSLGDLHPLIRERALDTQLAHADEAAEGATVERQLRYLDRLIDLDGPRDTLVVGCGPAPTTLAVLAELGHRATGLELVPSYVEAARTFLGPTSPARMVEASVEAMPFPAASFDVVWCQSVLEHVDAPERALAEMARVLRPGGVAVINTTNRLQVLPDRNGGEFRIPFFNWFPPIVRESYIHAHLHRDPTLARYTSRPAVHWFTFAQLCEMGRAAGFAWFYSWLDLLDLDDAVIARSRFRRAVLRNVQRSPWIRAVALSQIGSTVVMRVRPEGA